MHTYLVFIWFCTEIAGLPMCLMRLGWYCVLSFTELHCFCWSIWVQVLNEPIYTEIIVISKRIFGEEGRWWLSVISKNASTPFIKLAYWSCSSKSVAASHRLHNQCLCNQAWWTRASGTFVHVPVWSGICLRASGGKHFCFNHTCTGSLTFGL